MQVQACSTKQPLVAPLQTITKNGYLYVYVSNESPQPVYFDDLTVRHTSGPLLQEQAYYPYGLQMAGISDRAVNKTGNPFKFNAGSELQDEDGLEYYNTFYRKYDAQIGRFTGIDMLAEFSFVNPYQFGLNSPAMFSDPTGALTTNGLNDVLDQLNTSKYGGTWSSGSSQVKLFGSFDEGFGWGASYMTANNLWGMGDVWASSFGEALSNYTGAWDGVLVNGIQGYNYVSDGFTGAYATKKYEGDQNFNSQVGQNYYYAGYGDIFDYNAMQAGYAIHQASAASQVQLSAGWNRHDGSALAFSGS